MVDIFSPQSIQETLVRLKDPKTGVKVNKKIVDKKRRIVTVAGTSLTEWLLRDLGERNVVTKQDVVQLCQIFLDRQIMSKSEGKDPRKFSEEDSYCFKEGASENLELEIILKNSDQKTIAGVAQLMGSNIELKEKKHRLRKFKNAFSGQEAVTWLCDNLGLEKKEDAIILGSQLQTKSYIINLLSKTEPFNEKAIYRFAGGASNDDENDEEELSPTPATTSPTGGQPSGSGETKWVGPTAPAREVKRRPPPIASSGRQMSGNLPGNPAPVSPSSGGPPPLTNTISSPALPTSGTPTNLSRGPPPPARARPPPPRNGPLPTGGSSTSSITATPSPSGNNTSPNHAQPPPNPNAPANPNAPGRPALAPRRPPPILKTVSTDDANALGAARPPPPRRPMMAATSSFSDIPASATTNTTDDATDSSAGSQVPVIAANAKPKAPAKPPARVMAQHTHSSPADTPENKDDSAAHRPSPPQPLAPHPSAINSRGSDEPAAHSPGRPSPLSAKLDQESGSAAPPPRVPRTLPQRSSQNKGNAPAPQAQLPPPSPKRREPEPEPEPQPVQVPEEPKFIPTPEPRAVPVPARAPAPKRTPIPQSEAQVWVASSGKEEEHVLIKKQLFAAEQSFVNVVALGLNTYLDNNRITEREKEVLFANLDEIVNGHRLVLEQAASSSAADILLALVPVIGLYITYCANLPNAFSLLSKLRERGALSDMPVDDSFNVPTIEALLEIPKQHLDDYSAMTKNFIDRTNPATHAADLKKFTQAAQQIEAVQQQVRKRDTVPRHLVRIWDIEHSFIPKENMHLDEDRELYHDGVVRLLKDSAKPVDPQNNNLYVYIFRGLIICAEQVNGYSLQSLIKSSPENITVRDVAECPNGLEFSCNGRSLLVSVPTPDQKRRWMTDLPIKYPDERKPLKNKLVF